MAWLSNAENIRGPSSLFLFLDGLINISSQIYNDNKVLFWCRYIKDKTSGGSIGSDQSHFRKKSEEEIVTRVDKICAIVWFSLNIAISEKFAELHKYKFLWTLNWDPLADAFGGIWWSITANMIQFWTILS